MSTEKEPNESFQKIQTRILVQQSLSDIKDLKIPELEEESGPDKDAILRRLKTNS